MQEILSIPYYWLTAGHLIFVIFCIARLLLLPRFFVYHQEAPTGSDEAARWVEREKRLLRIILTPSLVLVWLLGLALVVTTGAHTQGWFHAKLLLVLALSGYHGWMSAYAKKLARGDYALSGRKLRLLNEVPGAAAALIVVLVVIKPF